jgi:hypothetical protein
MTDLMIAERDGGRRAALQVTCFEEFPPRWTAWRRGRKAADDRDGCVISMSCDRKVRFCMNIAYINTHAHTYIYKIHTHTHTHAHTHTNTHLLGLDRVLLLVQAAVLLVAGLG